LIPGQQASIGQDKKIRIVDHANIEEALAWKNGFFQFEGTSLAAVMRQLSRWYDTDVIFEGDTPDKEFVGSISRNVNASSVLKMLEFAGVHCRIENRKIIVMSK
jgi:ferric-dicitrate binding protein FerR (iron transport regulator)